MAGKSVLAKLLRPERFAQVVIHPRIQAFLAIIGEGMRGQGDDGHMC